MHRSRRFRAHQAQGGLQGRLTMGTTMSPGFRVITPAGGFKYFAHALVAEDEKVTGWGRKARRNEAKSRSVPQMPTSRTRKRTWLSCSS